MRLMVITAFIGSAFLSAAPLLLPNGGWWALGVLAALGGVRIIRAGIRPSSAKVLALPVRWLCCLPLLLATVTLLACAVQGGGAWQSEWPRLLVLLLSALAVYALPWLNVSAAIIFAAFVFTGLAAGGWALWQKGVQGVSRASGHEPFHAILFGNLALAVGVFCLAGLAWAWQQPKRWVWLVVFGLGALGGLSASLFSGTRGGWLALPLAGWVFYRAYLPQWPLRWRAGLLAMMVALAIGLYALPQTGVEQRVGSAVEEGQDYLQGDAHGSVGVRLELYRTSLQLIAAKPWLGYSREAYQSALQALYSEGEIGRGVARHWHAHNDLLNAWLRYGMLGALATLLLYLWPLWFFSRQLGVASPEQRPLALAGCLLPILFFDFGLSYAFFAYPVVLATYWVWLAVLVGGVLHGQKEVLPK